MLRSWLETKGYIHSDDRDMADEAFAAAESERSSYVVDYPAVRPDGEMRYVREAGDYIDVNGTKSPRSIGSLLDFTELRRTKAALKENWVALHLAQTHAGFGHYIVDP